MDERYGAWAARWRVPLGFALGIVYVVLSQPTVPWLAAGGGVAFAGLLLRAWAAGYLEKNQKLATAGPYAYTRNPLYFGSFLMGAGFTLAGKSWIVAALYASLVIFVYWPVMRREERQLQARFGNLYTSYAAAVPLFLPRLRRRATPADERFRWERYRRNREYEAAGGFAAGIIFLWIKMALR
jgi:protein-S-isoprenylcysteine O-methyltransferase Ste14